MIQSEPKVHMYMIFQKLMTMDVSKRDALLRGHIKGLGLRIEL